MITVQDTTRPTITVGALNDTVQCDGSGNTGDFMAWIDSHGGAMAVDGCGSFIWDTTLILRTPGCGKTRADRVLFIARDACGNADTTEGLFVIIDTIPPLMQPAPADTLVGCPSDVPLPMPLMYRDDCDGNIRIAFAQDMTESYSCDYTITRRWIGVDACGNRDTVIQLIRVKDTIAPVIPDLVDGDTIRYNCTDPLPVTLPPGMDACGSVSVSYEDSTETPSCPGEQLIRRKYTARDVCGNTKVYVNWLQFRDTTPPQITCPADVVLDCPADTSSVNTGVATAVDACGSIMISYRDSIIPGCGNTYRIIRLWTAVDACLNSSSCSQMVTVQDTIAPEITCPAALTLDCPADTSTANTGVATAIDECNNITINYRDSIIPGCGNTYTVIRIWTAMDACLNSSSCSQMITIQDTMAPEITCPAAVTLDCPADTSTTNTGIATAMDECNSVLISHRDSIIPGCGSTYLLIRIWTAVDACMNSSTCHQSITIQDTTAPEITCPAPITLDCPADTSTANTGVATAMDACNSVTISYRDSIIPGCGSTYTVIRIWTAVDACMNSSSCSQLITVQDTIAPVISCPASVTLNCPADTSTANTGIATATDACATAPLAITHSDSIVIACGSTYSILRRWMAMDACGNSSLCVQAIVIQDTTAPSIITEASNDTFHCDGAGNTSDFIAWINNHGGAQASDECNGVTWDTSMVDRMQLCGRTRIDRVLFIAQDACGNMSTTEAFFVIIDTIPPVMPSAPHDTLVACRSNVPLPSPVMYRDACDQTIRIAFSQDLSEPLSCDYTITRRWIGMDACGNRDTVIQLIRVKDSIPPVLPGLVHGDTVVYDCTDPLPTTVPQGMDNCSAVNVSYSDSTETPECAGEQLIKRTYTAVDFCGNRNVIVNWLLFRDTTPPAFIMPVLSDTVDCDALSMQAYRNWIDNHGGALATDNCSSVTWDTTTVLRALPCGSTRKDSVLFIVRDACNNADTMSGVFVIQDTTPPSLPVPPRDTLVECPNQIPAAQTLIATDACNGVVMAVPIDIAEDFSCDYQIIRKWVFSDLCGNKDSIEQHIRVKDSIPPTFIDPVITDGDTTFLDCNDTIAVDTPAVVDACGLPVVQYQDSLLGPSCGANTIVRRIYTATDVCENTARLTHYYQFIDTTAPEITIPPRDTIVECDGTGNNDAFISWVAVQGGAEATDACGTIQWDYVLAGSVPLCGSTRMDSILFIARDGCGNADTASALFTVIDTTPPVIDCPQNIQLNCPADTSVSNTGMATAVDQCSSMPLITYQDSVTPGSCPNIFRLHRYWTATDACGNSSVCRQTIDVRDITPPVVSCPQDLLLDCDARTDVGATGVATAADGCNPNPVISYRDSIVPGSCANAYTILRIWSARDACGNIGACTQRLMIRDRQAPIIACPANRTLDCTESILPDSTGFATATDACDPNPLITYADTFTLGSCPQEGTLVRTWRATDACGNSRICRQILTIVDQTGPVITCPANVTLSCADDTSAVIRGTATATDNCSGTIQITHLDAIFNGSCPNNYNLRRRWMAVDACGNSSVCDQFLFIRDTSPPLISCPAAVTVSCSADTIPTSSGLPTVSDVCDPNPLITYSDGIQNSTCANRFTALRTWVATDDCGNSSSCTQVITVNDQIVPVITCPVAITVDCALGTDTTFTGVATATDNCIQSPVIAFSDQTISTTCANTYTLQRTWRATDVCNNSATCIQNIRVVDTTAPEVTCPRDTVIDCASIPDPGQTGYPVYSDNCDGNPIATYADLTIGQSCANTYVLRRIWTVTDACGNSDTCWQRIEVVDTSAPILNIPPDTILICPIDTAIAVTGTATASDQCDTIPSVSYSDNVTNGVCASDFTVNRVWVAVDACGNSASQVQIIRVHDTIPPVIICPLDTVLNCPADTTPSNTGIAIADDGCSLGLNIFYKNEITPGGCPDVYSLARTWYAEDNCGNIDSCIQIIQVIDTTPPQPLFIMRDTLVGCPLDVPIAGPLPVSDACSGNQVILPVTRTVGSDCDYYVYHVWTYSDACGNVDSTVQRVHVKDSIPPEILSLQDGDTIDFACTDPLPVTLPAGTDACGSVSVSFVDSTLAPPCPGEQMIRRVFTAMDLCGNTRFYTNWLWFHDTLAPALTNARDTLVDCDGAGNLQAFADWISQHGRAVATDNCSGVIWDTVTVSTTYGCGATRIDSVRFIARDSCGNTSSVVGRFVIQDTTPPAIVILPKDTLFACDGNGNVSGFSAWIDQHAGMMASDVCSEVIWDTMTVATINDCEIGMSRQVKFLVSDACGNRDSALASFTIIDTVPPVIMSEAKDTLVTCDSLDINLVFEMWMNDHGGARATDNCSLDNLTWTSRVTDTVEDCSMLPTYRVVFYVADECNNQDSTIAIFSVIDTLAPNIAIPADTIILCDQDTSPVNLGNPVAADNCSMVTVSHTDSVAAGACISQYQIFRTWVVKDQCGNTTSGIQFIQVIDTVPPMINCPSTTNASCNFTEVPIFGSYQSFIDSGGVALDNCQLDTASFTYVNSYMDTIGRVIVLHRVYQIADACGNTSTCDHAVSLEDLIPPVASCRAGFQVMAGEDGLAHLIADSLDNGSTDNCGIDSIYVVPNVLSCGFFYGQEILREVTLVVVDQFGNVGTCTTLVSVVCPCPPDGIPLSCQDQVKVSLASDCQRIVGPADVLAMEVLSCYDPYKIIIYDADGNALGNTVNESHVGQKLTYTIIDTLNGNRCWGDLKVEQSYPPAFTCVDDTISCLDPIPPVPDAPAGCTFAYRLRVLDEQWTDYGCDDQQFMGVLRRRLLVNDPWNNYTECTQNIYIRKENLAGLVCPVDTVLNGCLIDGNGQNRLLDTTFVVVDALGYPHPKPLVENGKVSGLVPVPYLIVQEDTFYLQFRDKGCNLVVDYQDEVIPLCTPSFMIRRTWIIKDWCTGEERSCVQRISIVDTTGPDLALASSITIPVETHSCKGKVPIVVPKIIEHCPFPYRPDDPGYSIRYELLLDQEGQQISYAGDLTGQTEYIYLPVGKYQLHYFVSDACWNQQEFIQTVWVVDDQPPVAICDEITQVTLDPDSCQARIYARDLDDGSYDGCCEKLHFAVASTAEIDYWTNYWNDQLNTCHPELDAVAKSALIEHWVDCYVFNDYVYGRNCGNEQLVLRVYEACDLPTRDPHLFFGNEHAWFCWNLYDDYACYFRLHYDQVTEDQIPVPDLCQESWVTACYESKHEHGTSYQNALCCTYPIQELAQWQYIQWQYPEIGDYGLSSTRRWFQHLYSDCMIQLYKDDKVPPVVVAPADVTLYCDGVPGQVQLNEKGGYVLTDPGHAWNVCAEEDHLTTGACRSSGWYQDIIGGSCCVTVPWDGEALGYYSGSLPYDESCNNDWYANNWQPWYCKLWLELDRYDHTTTTNWRSSQPAISDACTPQEDLIIDYREDNQLNDCGAGSVVRTWTVTDGCGNVTEAHQTVRVLARSDFEVLFPADTTVLCTDQIALDASAEGAGVPFITDDECEQIGISYQDERVQLDGSACYQIKRTWKLINWCVFQGDHASSHPEIIVDDRKAADSSRPCIYRNLKDNGDGYMEYVQIIRVDDRTAPVLTMSPDTTICTYWADCDPDTSSITLGQAIDNCTSSEVLRYTYRWWPVNIPGEIHAGAGNVLRDRLPYGTIHVEMKVEDLCGNVDTGSIQVTVTDCKPPVPYCFDGIVTVVMDSTGQIVVPASVFNAGSYDNCTPQNALKFSFSADGQTPERTFTCLDIPNGKEALLDLEMWVLDANNHGNYCTTQLRLQDNSGNVCQDVNTNNIVQGNIHTQQGEGIDRVDVRAMQTFLSDTSDIKGDYEIQDLKPGIWYTIQPHRNHDPLNGVSTLDLVQIHKHILGMEPFTNPYQYIAADINNSQTINVLDLVELRKLILGVLDSFPHNTSWRFIPKNYSFPDVYQPWNFPETVDVLPPVPDSIQHDFVGIKIGDLNASVLPNGLVRPEIRSHENLLIQIEDRLIVPGDTAEIPVYGLDYQNITGWQWTLGLGGLKFLDVLPGMLQLDDKNVGLRWASDGLVTMSWDHPESDTIASDQALFTLRVQANDTTRLSDVLHILSSKTPAEAYRGSEEILGVDLQFLIGREVVRHEQMTVYQNHPNPFNEKTWLGFELPEADNLIIRIMDQHGRTIKIYRNAFAAGYHEVEVNGDGLPQAGILYYQVESSNRTTINKMIRLQ